MSKLALLGGSPVVTEPLPQWPPHRELVAAAVHEVALSDHWGAVDGPRKLELESRFAAFQDAAHGLAVSNGTVSLEIAMRTLGIGSGDEVIVPAYTFLATATTVLTVNALPVFVDVLDTSCIDPAAVEAAHTPRTRAINAGPLGGQSADLDALTAIAEKHGLFLIEDAAQAHGATWQGKGVGSRGAFGSFSFQASKNLTSGEGGFLTSNDVELADLAWSFHNCGRSRTGKWYQHEVLGGNHRMTEFQAATLLTLLDRLPEQVERREAAAARLAAGLADVDGLTPGARDPRATTHAFHIYQMVYDTEAFGGLSRERFVEALTAEGVVCSGGYGLELNRQPVFARANFDRRATGYDPEQANLRYAELDLPVTRRLCAEAVWFYQTMLVASDDYLDRVLEAIVKVRAGAAALAAA
jgi:dTDP-4-amino-4,6-dideoxygalactose transaminase